MPAPVAMRLKFAASCVPGAPRWSGRRPNCRVPGSELPHWEGRPSMPSTVPIGAGTTATPPSSWRRRSSRTSAVPRSGWWLPRTSASAASLLARRRWNGPRPRQVAPRRCSWRSTQCTPAGCAAAERSVRCARNVARPRPHRRRVGDGGRGGARRSTERRRGHRPGCGGASPAGAARVRHERGGARPRVDPDGDHTVAARRRSGPAPCDVATPWCGAPARPAARRCGAGRRRRRGRRPGSPRLLLGGRDERR